MSVSWIVPAHNEAATIGAVVSAIVAADRGSVLVVADTCDDGTAELAHQAGAAVVRANAGDKSTAMWFGVVTQPDATRIGFIDGDLRDLQPGHIELLAAASPDCMAVGLRDTTQRLRAFPPIGGERVVPAEVARRTELRRAGYRAEMRLAATARGLRVPIVEVPLPGLQHTTSLDPTKILPRWLGVWRGWREYSAPPPAHPRGRRPPYAVPPPTGAGGRAADDVVRPG